MSKVFFVRILKPQLFIYVKSLSWLHIAWHCRDGSWNIFALKSSWNVFMSSVILDIKTTVDFFSISKFEDIKLNVPNKKLFSIQKVLLLFFFFFSSGSDTIQGCLPFFLSLSRQCHELAFEPCHAISFEKRFNPRLWHYFHSPTHTKTIYRSWNMLFQHFLFLCWHFNMFLVPFRVTLKNVCVWITFFCVDGCTDLARLRRRIWKKAVERTIRTSKNRKALQLKQKLTVFYVYKFKHFMFEHKLLSVCLECLQDGICRTTFLLTFYWICVLIIVSKNLNTENFLSKQTDFM